MLAAWIAGTRSATISNLTVTDDGSLDTLDGGSDVDWFLDFLDSLTDFDTKKGDKKNFV